ncbi:hypothetical protein V1477_011050 [Vespula maculifrons]|uniref:Uncharacterized protein n=1 Tax=Vespula maculifrons TaxID=7453 RepID=A0ABD2C3P0_VESMC
MPFRFGSFRLLSKLEMYKTPLTDCSTVHTVGFRHIETRPVVHALSNTGILLGILPVKVSGEYVSAPSVVLTIAIF